MGGLRSVREAVLQGIVPARPAQYGGHQPAEADYRIPHTGDTGADDERDEEPEVQEGLPDAFVSAPLHFLGHPGRYHHDPAGSRQWTDHPADLQPDRREGHGADQHEMVRSHANRDGHL